MADLKDKIVLVTGAAGAIGQAAVAAVKAAGGIALAADLKAGAGIDALDVTAEVDWQRLTAGIERNHSRLDGLVNAAGVVALGSVEQLDFAAWRRVLSVNLDGTFLGCKYSMPLLRKKGGAIV
ncbi:MAG: SDR family NAD(P)-dependent oxidoreductase, partial [Pseudolabrys sp.]